MKLPTKTTGRHKIRDTKICMLWARELMSSESISEMFKLSIRRVQQIVYANRDFLKKEREWEKTKRVRWLEQQIKKSGDTKKDSADLIEQLRKEIEGDKPNIEKHIHFTTVIQQIHERANDQREERDRVRIDGEVAITP